MIRRKQNVTGSVSFGRQIGFQFTIFNTKIWEKVFNFWRFMLYNTLNFPTFKCAVNRDGCILFIWGFTSLSTLYRSYHDGQRKPVHTVRQGSVL